MQRPIYANTELKYGFGDYVQLSDGETSNDMTERTRGALALMPTGNRDRSWYFLILKTWEVVRRTNLDFLPIPDEVIEYINQKSRLNRAKRGIVGEVIKMGLWRSNDINDYNNEDEEQNEQDEEDMNDEDNVYEYLPIYNEGIGQDYFELLGNDDNAVNDVVDNDVDEQALMNDIFEDDSDVENEPIGIERQEEQMQDENPINEDNRENNDNDENDIDMQEQNAEVDQPYRLRESRAQPGRWKGIASALRKRKSKKESKNSVKRKRRRRVYQMTIN